MAEASNLDTDQAQLAGSFACHATHVVVAMSSLALALSTRN